LAQQIGQGQLRVLAATGVSQIFTDELAQTETLVQLADQQQASVGGDLGALEIRLQRGTKREAKRLVFCLTHWMEASGAVFWPSKLHEHWCFSHHKGNGLNFKKEIRG
jgi:hypothetical protein